MRHNLNMKHTIHLLWVLLMSPVLTHAQPIFAPTNNLHACAHHAPFGWPQVHILDHVLICRSGHALQFDNSARLAAWVQYVLHAEHTVACGVRPTQFQPDPLVPLRARVSGQNYARSGWDQGHLAPNADQSWHPQVQQESFYLTNVAPQHPQLNRQLWNRLEQAVRTWTHAHGAHVIITGVIYGDSTQTLGFHQIRIPTHFYKIITHVESHRTWAFLAENSVTPHRDIARIQSTVSAIAQLSGIRFAQPDNPRLRRPLRPLHAQEMLQERRLSCEQR